MRSIGRRELLGGTAIAVVVLAGEWSILIPATARQGADLDSFMVVSQSLVGSTVLDRDIGERLLHVFVAQVPDFASALGRLASVLIKESLDGDMQALALRIQRAWYTGQIGNTIITFEKALMFAAVSDVLPVRTYCINRPNSWAKNPNT